MSREGACCSFCAKCLLTDLTGLLSLEVELVASTLVAFLPAFFLLLGFTAKYLTSHNSQCARQVQLSEVAALPCGVDFCPAQSVIHTVFRALKVRDQDTTSTRKSWHNPILTTCDQTVDAEGVITLEDACLKLLRYTIATGCLKILPSQNLQQNT